ncbi:response regulator transcription factor [Rhodoferax sp.]|uniref:response regulator transcription factor n=1 Tax=Rhodoferax sp. TaxID=50421 RepID=UPI002719E200|nr:response regulator [Rhodoferax sp.]MDO8321053.1 response regulator [Rhodoferax sp.]
MTEPAAAYFLPPKRVLVVEDDPALCAYLASALEDAGFSVDQAHDRAQAGVFFMSDAPPALVLLDLGLPPHASTMTEGLALLELALQASPACKIIVLTGQDEAAAALQAVRLGAFDFLVKPVSFAAILSALKRAQLFAQQESRLSTLGEARLHLTTRLDEGPKEAACNAEEQLLRRVMAATDYNVTEAARQLGLAREHIYYYLKKYGIQRPG